MIFIGDVAGQFDCLMRLVNKLPKEEKIVLLGDLNDRGPRSKDVINWAMTDPRVECTLHSNHGHMMVDWYMRTNIYDLGIWKMNGGNATMKSYGVYKNTEKVSKDFRTQVHREHITWLASRPLYYECEVDGKKVVATHAPIHANMTLEEALLVDINNEHMLDFSVIWNREKPGRKPFYQIFGHNSYWGFVDIADKDGDFATCIDTSATKILTAWHWPSRAIWQEPYKS